MNDRGGSPSMEQRVNHRSDGNTGPEWNGREAGTTDCGSRDFLIGLWVCLRQSDGDKSAITRLRGDGRRREQDTRLGNKRGI